MDRLDRQSRAAGRGSASQVRVARGLGGELRYEPRPGGGAAFLLELP